MNQPNVIIILADDLGFSDLGCFGGEISTPNLDSLAEHGLRMSNFYATPRCSPSRASLLTGHHPHGTGIGILTSDDRPHGYAGSIDPTIPTVAERFREVGYRTCLSGKWHLASDTVTPNDSWPTRRGFENFYGVLPGCSSYYQPRMLYRNEERVDKEAFAPGYYITDAITSHANAFVRSAYDEGKPFLLYLAYTAPHWPLHAPDEDVDRYAGNFDDGWDVLRKRRMRALIDRGIIPAHMELSPRDPREPAWEDVQEKAWQARRMEVYAAQVEVMDRNIGRLVDTLRETGELDNTLIVFLSDNGACAEPLPTVPASQFLDANMCPPETRAGEAVMLGNDPTIVPGPEESYSSYGRAWANLSNTPFRLYKRWGHEGGIASPLIVHWPDGALTAGSTDDGPAQLVDILPTLLDAIGAPDKELVGTSLLSEWRGLPSGIDQDRPLFWEHIGNGAIRIGRWKLVREEGQPWELYDLYSDRAELNDLAALHPERVQEMESRWENWARNSGVISWSDVLGIYRSRGQDRAPAKS